MYIYQVVMYSFHYGFIGSTFLRVCAVPFCDDQGSKYSLFFECNTCIFVQIKLNSKYGTKIIYCIHCRYYQHDSIWMSTFIAVCAHDVWFVMDWHTEWLFTPLWLNTIRNWANKIDNCYLGANYSLLVWMGGGGSDCFTVQTVTRMLPSRAL